MADTPFINLRRILRNSTKILNDYFSNFQTAFERNGFKAYQFLRTLVYRLHGNVENPWDVVIRWPGTFYFFGYKSKLYLEGRLPFYDAFPLILVLAVDRKGFLGINWHYIHPKMRAMILKKLMVARARRFTNDEPLIPMNWRLFQAMMGAKKKYTGFAVKRYLWSHVKGIGGIKATRVKNMEMLNAISYTSPDWIGITEAKIQSLIRQKTG